MRVGYLFEVCVDSVESAIIAQEAGAHRLELCADLFEGGITPSLGMIKRVLERVSIPVNVLIRPRGGDFHYAAEEFEVMRSDVEMAKELGANGIVIGIMHPDGSIDLPRCAALIELARPLSVTFHRAFDMARDPFQALEDIISLGAERILTSGQERSAVEGLDLLAQLVLRAGERIIILAGGGIRPHNIAEVARRSGGREFHFAAQASIESPMVYRNERVHMGDLAGPPEYSISVADGERIRATIAALS